MKAWYTLYTKYNCEHQVVHALAERGIETYLPLLGTPSSKNSHQQRPLLPCYLFVHIDLAQVGLSQLIWTPGLRSVVAFDNQPAMVPSTVIRFLKQRLSNPAAKDPTPSFKEGETVEITDGPFQGMEAIVAGPLKSDERIAVFLTMLGRLNKAEVDVSSLKKGSPSEVTASTFIKRPRRTRGRGRKIRASIESDHA